MAAPLLASSSPNSDRRTDLPHSTELWASAAKVTVCLTIAATSATAITSSGLARSWARFEQGTTTFSELLAAEALHGRACTLYLIAQIAACAFVVPWMLKAAKNAEHINTGRMTDPPKWAIWGWIVPITNLVPFTGSFASNTAALGVEAVVDVVFCISGLLFVKIISMTEDRQANTFSAKDQLGTGSARHRISSGPRARLRSASRQSTCPHRSLS